MSEVPIDEQRLEAILLAYAGGALGEMDRARVEALLRQRPELNARLMELRALQDGLRTGLRARPAPACLDELRRARIRVAAATGPRRAAGNWRAALLAAAAVLLVAVTMGQVLPLGDRAAGRASGIEFPSTRTPEKIDLSYARDLGGLAPSPSPSPAPRRADHGYGDVTRSAGGSAGYAGERWEAPKERSIVDQVRTDLDLPVEELETEDQEVSEVALAKGREEAVSLSQSGGFAAFMAIGPRGDLRPRSAVGVAGAEEAPIIALEGDIATRSRRVAALLEQGQDAVWRQLPTASPSDEHERLAYRGLEDGRNAAREFRPRTESPGDGLDGDFGDLGRGVPQNKKEGDGQGQKQDKRVEAEQAGEWGYGWQFGQVSGQRAPSLRELAAEELRRAHAKPDDVTRNGLSMLRDEHGILIDPPPQAAPPRLPQPPPQSLPADEPLPSAAPQRPPPASDAPPVNPWVFCADDRLSTFALDVDSASYAIARRSVRQGLLPPARAVRMEEFVNAFDYHYAPPRVGSFAVHAELAPAPFARPGIALLKIGVKAAVVGRDGARPAHLVLVVDASGSMDRDDRLPLLRRSLESLLERLSPHDRVSLIAYGSQPRLLLDAHSAADATGIRSALAAVQAGGATNLLDGLHLGYQLAERHFVAGAVNQVLLLSDGVANVGATASDEILARVGRWREQGISCSTVGVGTGAYNDALLERLANSGDGSYLYLDPAEETREAFVAALSAALNVVAYDAKIQVAFDPERVRRYRLIGYENREIRDQDFRNDRIDAGEVGSGQAATALYELELHHADDGALVGDIGTVYVRWRDAAGGAIEEIGYGLPSTVEPWQAVDAAPRFHLAAAAAEYAELLRGSEHAAGGDFDSVLSVLSKIRRALPLDQQVDELYRLVAASRGLPRAP